MNQKNWEWLSIAGVLAVTTFLILNHVGVFNSEGGSPSPKKSENLPELIVINEARKLPEKLIVFGIILAEEARGPDPGFIYEKEDPIHSSLPKKIGVLPAEADVSRRGYVLIQAIPTDLSWQEDLTGEAFWETDNTVIFDNATDKEVSILIDGRGFPNIPPGSHGIVSLHDGDHTIEVKSFSEPQPIDLRTVHIQESSQRGQLCFYVYNIQGKNSYSVKSALYGPSK